MNLAGGNNPCGTEKPDWDASDLGEIISAEQKSKIEMHPAGRNHPYGTEKQDRDADNFRFLFLLFYRNSKVMNN